MYDGRGDYSRAEQLYKRALTLREKFAGQDPIDEALARSCKRSDAALPKCQAHLDVALSLNDLAAVYEHQGDYDKAEREFNHALEICEKLLPPEHPFLVKLLNNLAVVFDDKNEFERSEELLQRVLRIRLETLGQNHPRVALSLNNLASHYVRTRNFGRAEELFNQALAMDRQVLPENHVDIALILSNFAALSLAKGEPGRGVELLAQAANIQEQHLSLLLAVGSEKQKQLYLDTLVNDTNQTVSLHIKAALYH